MTITISDKYTVNELEAILDKPEYKAFKRLDYDSVQPALMDGVRKQDDIISFGQEAIDLFENLTNDLGRIPTQKEYIEASLPIHQTFWEENQLTHNKINGYPFTKGVKLGIMDRIARNYTSRIVELHLELLLRDMGYTVKTHNLIDVLMGVDLIIEDGFKRHYIHVTTSKYSRQIAEKSVMRKQKRGSLKVGSNFVRYCRDFKGDLILCYDSLTPLGEDSTKRINNNPVFKRAYIEEYLAVKRLGNSGEKMSQPISKPVSKLDDFILWAKANLNIEIFF